MVKTTTADWAAVASWRGMHESWWPSVDDMNHAAQEEQIIPAQAIPAVSLGNPCETANHSADSNVANGKDTSAAPKPKPRKGKEGKNGGNMGENWVKTLPIFAILQFILAHR